MSSAQHTTPRAQYPTSAQQAADLVAQARAADSPLCPWGMGGSGFAKPTERTLISSRKLDQVEELLTDNLSLRVQAGMTLARAQEVAAEVGAFLPLNLEGQGGRTLGGLMATGAAGRDSLLWGSLKDQVLGMQMVTPDGHLVETGGRTVKNVAGLDLTRLLWRSRGCLGLCTALTLKLTPRPPRRAEVALPLESAAHALVLARELITGPWALGGVFLLGHSASRRKGWLLVAALAGFATTVDQQARALMERHQEAKPRLRVDQECADFWRGYYRSFPLERPDQSLGRGDRRDLVELLAAWTGLDGLVADGVAVEADLGRGALRLKLDPADLFRRAPFVWAADQPQPGPLYRRLKDSLDPRGIFPEPDLFTLARQRRS